MAAKKLLSRKQPGLQGWRFLTESHESVARVLSFVVSLAIERSEWHLSRCHPLFRLTFLILQQKNDMYHPGQDRANDSSDKITRDATYNEPCP